METGRAIAGDLRDRIPSRFTIRAHVICLQLVL